MTVQLLKFFNEAKNFGSKELREILTGATVFFNDNGAHTIITSNEKQKETLEKFVACKESIRII